MSADENLDWLFDSITGFLKGPDWALPVMSFIDENCIVFDSEDENKLAHMEIYSAFREMIDSLLEVHLNDLGVKPEVFAAFCAKNANTEIGREVIEQILAVDDYMSFKKMMVKRNMELELESLKALQALSEKVSQGGEAGAESTENLTEEEEFEKEMQAALELSLKEAGTNGINTSVDGQDLAKQQQESEDAEFEMAIQLSLQLEKQNLDAEQSELEEALRASQLEADAEEAAKAAAVAAEAAKAADAANAAAAAAAAAKAADAAKEAAAAAAVAKAKTASAQPAAQPVAAAPKPAAAPLGALPPLTGMPRMPKLPGGVQPSAKEIRSAQAAADAGAKAAAARDRAEKEREVSKAAQEQSLLADVTASRQAEMAARAEHLKKQRDLIVAQKRRQREQDVLASRDPAPEGASAVIPPTSNMTEAAGYSEGAAGHRALLSRALASSLKASLRGGDGESLQLQQRIEAHDRRLDLEATKAELRAEADRLKEDGF